MSAIPPTWTPDRIEQLRKHFEAGLSCSQIAREIDVTRNAVIGKLSRLGLSRPGGDVVIRRQPGSHASPRAGRPRAVARQSQVRILRSLHAAMAAPASAEPPVDDYVSDRPRCSLFDLSPQSCRWPIGSPGADDFGFCGSAPVEGLPYCAGHARMAYKSTARRHSA